MTPTQAYVVFHVDSPGMHADSMDMNATESSLHDAPLLPSADVIYLKQSMENHECNGDGSCRFQNTTGDRPRYGSRVVKYLSVSSS